MAWNVVIAGGGFGGAAAARELERVMPRQSARLVLVNETNFMLYTPFLPEAAAGTLEPRHVVTPLRDILKRTYLRIGSIVGHDPAAKTVQLRAKYGEVETLVYDLGGNGKSQILKTAGGIKVVRKPGAEVVGIHMVGARVGELVGEAQLAVNWEAHPDDVAPLIHAHPTQTEALGEAFLALAGKPLHSHS